MSRWPAAGPAPGDPEAILSGFEKQYAALDNRIAQPGESSWQNNAQLSIAGKLYKEAPVGEFLWYLFFDAIHHRGQLSTYEYLHSAGGRPGSLNPRPFRRRPR